MENCRWIVIVGALVVGAALGTLVGYVFFSPEVPEGNARTVDVETAHAFILKYWETPTKETMVGCQISLGQIQAINTFLNETSGDSREVSGFRFYRAMDEENKDGTVIVGLGPNGTDLTDLPLFFTNDRYEPCPTICDLSSPLVEGVSRARGY